MADIVTPTHNAPATAPATATSTGGLADPFTVLRRQMNRIFEDFGFGLPIDPFGTGHRLQDWIGTNWGAADVTETEADYRVSIELPGCAETDIEVTSNDNVLTVRAKKLREERPEKATQYRAGRQYGSFYQTFRLPDDVDAAKMAASYKNGVLELVLPKTAPEKRAARRIPVTKA